MKASLVPLHGGPPIEILKDITLIGRKDFCDVRLDDSSISKVHLLIAKTDGLLLFRDMASTNGTKVNGQRVVRGALLPNDNLQIAALQYQVQLLPDEPSAANEAARMDAPEGEDAAAIRIFRAEELAVPNAASAQPARVDPKRECIVKENEAARASSPSDSKRILSTASPNGIAGSLPDKSPQFVD